ncbi:hypothetical protein EGR_10035 [Echinococcus granulosus]|uniref:Uncharacterized protein n=1 Tax=Echinococcus granulosus TaxID=6210 RepID=W6U224_ECHGR|nr:hypothetical protein EGR_10035 [Echinococcus granulosus]EUB55098.1 hypothetical protein EGR_10035 [Echinococcus granulosus]
MALLPVSVLVYGSTIESIIDSVLKDVPEYLTTNGEQSQVESIESLVRSCPFSFYENLLNGEVAYTLSIYEDDDDFVRSPQRPTNVEYIKRRWWATWKMATVADVNGSTGSIAKRTPALPPPWAWMEDGVASLTVPTLTDEATRITGALDGSAATGEQIHSHFVINATDCMSEMISSTDLLFFSSISEVATSTGLSNDTAAMHRESAAQWTVCRGMIARCLEVNTVAWHNFWRASGCGIQARASYSTNNTAYELDMGNERDNHGGSFRCCLGSPCVCESSVMTEVLLSNITLLVNAAANFCGFSISSTCIYAITSATVLRTTTACHLLFTTRPHCVMMSG